MWRKSWNRRATWCRQGPKGQPRARSSGRVLSRSVGGAMHSLFAALSGSHSWRRRREVLIRRFPTLKGRCGRGVRRVNAARQGRRTAISISTRISGV